jgi:dUTP pyrophosphatase
MSTNEELVKGLEKLLKGLEEEIFDDDMEFEGIPIQELDEVVMGNNHLIPLHFTKVSEGTITPKYNYPSDSGFDLYSTSDVKITGFGRSLISTGIKFDIPEGYEIQVRTKSGLALNHGLMVLNSPGTVDQGYNGEIKVIMFNSNPATVEISKGQKVAQAVLTPVVSGKWVNLIEVETINDKERGSNGFGSTGI